MSLEGTMTPNSVFYGPIEMPQTYRSTEATGSLIKLLRISSFFPPLVHWGFKFYALTKKKKKSRAQTFQFFCFRNHKKSLFYQRQKRLFSLPMQHTTELLLSPPTFSLPLSLSQTHTHTGRNTWAGSLRRHCHLVDSRPWSKKSLKHRSLLWELMKIKICHFS